MTFLEEIKQELESIRIKKLCCMVSELRGILMFGAVGYDSNALWGTDSMELAKRVSSFLKRSCEINYNERLSENAESYKFLIPDDILEKIGLKSGLFVTESEPMENEQCCMHAFIRGAFLASGSVANPEKAYRMEIFSENQKATDKVYEILVNLGVDAKRTKRKNLFVVYTNNSESVSDMLKVTEASMAVFKVLEAKVVKNKRNESNRVTNCDMANAERASENSYREMQAIRLIEKTVGLDSLKPRLREAALMRIENEGASIQELANMYDPPLAKSTMNNRLNKLIEIAKEIGE